MHLAPTSVSHVFDAAPALTKADGSERRVGVEVEFAGLGVRDAAAALAHRMGGRIVEEDPHAYRIEDGPLGPLTVTMDSRYVHPETARALFGEIGARLAPFVGHATRPFVPNEMVTGPIPFDRLPEVDHAVGILREAGALGTSDSVLNAFGLHFNPEPVDLEADTVLAHLRAYILLEPWLRRTLRPDRMRDLLGFAAPFEADYARLVLAPGTAPDMGALIDRHLAYNPSRNRGLDLLPLFSHVDGARVRARLPREKIGPRPTFHYRLPDARVSEEGWGIAPDWNRWIAIERLAADRTRLESLSEAYLSHAGGPESWGARLASEAA